MRHIPNFITTLNLASGFFSIVLMLRGELETACFLIAASMILDFLDGFAARLLNAYSDMGKELDSLADMVSFGAAPGLLIYIIAGGEKSLSEGIPVILVSTLYAVCACLRLARFNTDTRQSENFIGLPTPAAAFAVISLVLVREYSPEGFMTLLAGSSAAVLIYATVISGLMVSSIPMASLKIRNLQFKGNEVRFVILGVSALILIIAGIPGAVLIIPAYVLISLISLYAGWL